MRPNSFLLAPCRTCSTPSKRRGSRVSQTLSAFLLCGLLTATAQADMLVRQLDTTHDGDTRCKTSSPISALQTAILSEVNLARTNPKQYAALLRQQYASLGEDKVYVSDGVRIRTEEGRQAVAEAIQFLEAAQPVPPVQLASCLSSAAQDHVNDQGQSGETGHVGRDGSQPTDRASRYLEREALCGENIDYGHASPRSAVTALVVDDGVPSRGHRNNIFHPDYKTMGVALGRHPTFRAMMVNVLCAQEISE